MSLISHRIIKAVIATFAVIVVTPIALSFASLKGIMRLFLETKMVVVSFVARVKKKMEND